MCFTTPHISLLSENKNEQAIWLMETQLADVFEQLFCTVQLFAMGSFWPLLRFQEA